MASGVNLAAALVAATVAVWEWAVAVAWAWAWAAEWLQVVPAVARSTSQTFVNPFSGWLLMLISIYSSLTLSDGKT